MIPSRSSPVRFLRVASALAAGLFLARAELRAEEAAGSLAGHVTAADSSLTLAGVRASVAGTHLEAYTDRQGVYRLDHVPAGPVTMTFSYIGYPDLQRTVLVIGGQVLRLDVMLGGETVKMAKVVISSEVVGMARAINDQRGSASLTSIVASDYIGQFPSHTVADSASFLPGVDVSKSKGEGRFVEIRGLDPIYLGVSMNGVRLATSEKGTREVPLDEIGSNQIAAMEVVKVNTPDMDADDMGGSVNITTRSAFDREGLQAMVGIGEEYAHQEDRRDGYNFQGYVGNTYDQGRFGVFVGVSAESRPQTDYAEPEASPWSLVTSPTDGQQHWLLGGQDFQHYNNTRNRDAVNVSLDYKIDDAGSKAWFRYFQSYYVERVNEWITEFDYPSTASAVQALTNTSATIAVPKNDVLKEETGDENNKDEVSLVGGLEKKFGTWTDDLVTGYTVGKYTRPTITIAFANTAPVVINYNFQSAYSDTVTQLSGPSIDDPSTYAFSTKSAYSATTAQMHEISVRDDLRDDFELADLPAFLKVGAQFRHKINGENTYKEGITSIPWTLPSNIYPGNDVQDVAGGFPDFRILPQTVWSFQQNQALYGTSLNIPTTFGGAFQAREDVAAVYAMGQVTAGDLKVSAGLRDESTDFWITGWQIETPLTGAQVVTPVVSTKTYSNLMPALILTYELDPKTIARASWTNTLARPDYSATIPGVNINDQVRTISQGNPQLPALQSANWDASLEHYYSPLGVVSAAVFYKDIKNFTYQAQVGASTNPATLGYLISSFNNVPSAWIYGLELAWSQRFGFLPPPFDGLGLQANGTFGDSAAKYPTRPGEELPYLGLAKQLANVALTYDLGGFHAQVSETYHGKRLEVDSALGTNSTQDEYEDRYLTVGCGLSYAFAGNWQVYLTGTNLNNAPLLEYYGGTGSLKRMQTYEAYGWSLESGIRWSY
jgi:TonB-dependent receptor